MFPIEPSVHETKSASVFLKELQERLIECRGNFLVVGVSPFNDLEGRTGYAARDFFRELRRRKDVILAHQHHRRHTDVLDFIRHIE